MNRLKELYEKMVDEAPLSFHPAQRSYIMELAEIYAKECSQASLEKASENTIHLLETYNAEHSEIKAEITDSENIVLL